MENSIFSEYSINTNCNESILISRNQNKFSEFSRNQYELLEIQSNIFRSKENNCISHGAINHNVLVFLKNKLNWCVAGVIHRENPKADQFTKLYVRSHLYFFYHALYSRSLALARLL